MIYQAITGDLDMLDLSNEEITELIRQCRARGDEIMTSYFTGELPVVDSKIEEFLKEITRITPKEIDEFLLNFSSGFLTLTTCALDRKLKF
jgi:hypothetical protein